MRFSSEDSLIPREKVLRTAEGLTPEIENMVRATSRGYSDSRASINLPDDNDMLARVKQIVEDKLQLKPEYLVVVGTGGSNLGTIAVQEAVLGKLYNQLNPAIKVLYADTTDSDYINDIIQLLEPTLKRDGSVLVNGISKSGTT
ncbi:MAG: hypothetical protein ACETV1_03255, partial [Candidatus Bathyarchaeia archaeon]